MTRLVPTLTEVAAALGKPDAEVRDTYLAEVAAQGRACRTEAYTDDLAAALVRRVRRARAMASVPLGVVLDDAGATRLGYNDPEIRRLEGPYRRLVVG